MGKADGVTKAYMRENEIFADAFNFYIYNGKQVIDPEQLQPLDTAEIARKHLKQEDHRGHSGDEYLSGFYKEDKIVPVITLVIFFGAKKWDDPLSLHEMMEEQPPEIMDLVQDYKIHLIQPATLTDEDLEKFQTSMREVMSFIKYSKDKGKIKSLLKDNPRFRGLRREAAMVIDEYTNMEFAFDEEESVNMCEGVQGLIDDAVEENIVENVKNLMKNMSLTMEQAMDALELSKEKKKIVSKTLQRVERRK